MSLDRLHEPQAEQINRRYGGSLTVREIPLEVDAAHGRMIVGDRDVGKAHILHCNYYNNYLLRTIWKDAGMFIEPRPILIGAAVEQSYFQLTGLFSTLKLTDVEERKAFASRFFSWQGLGTLDLTNISATGGFVISASQHYAEGWKVQFGAADEPVGFFTRGWLAGAASAIFDCPQGYFSAHQSECAAVTGGHRNVFELKPDGPNYHLYDGKGVGPLLDTADFGPEPKTNVDAHAIGQAVMTLPLFGSAEADGGLIKNFDVLITWLPHQYYDRISIECIRDAVKQFGVRGREAIEPLLEEAGHRCGFRTFGGIWRSMEWAALVEPMCESPEDWVMGMLAIVNCAGWGRVQCTKLSQDEAEFIVHNDYESVGYLNLYGQADYPTTYLLRGGFRGMMNLVFNGRIHDKPALTEAFYDSLSRHPDRYETHVEACRSMGDPVTVYRVKRRVA
jgi:hypothetical protein